MFENGVEYRLVVVLGDGLLHFQQGFATTDLEAGDVVVEPGRFVNQVPAHTWFLDTGQTRESFAEVHPRQVAVVHVAREDRYRGGRVAVRGLARCDGA